MKCDSIFIYLIISANDAVSLSIISLSIISLQLSIRIKVSSSVYKM